MLKAVKQLTTFKLKSSLSSFQKGLIDFKSNSINNDVILI